jgi:hypothetical protein
MGRAAGEILDQHLKKDCTKRYTHQRFFATWAMRNMMISFILLFSRCHGCDVNLFFRCDHIDYKQHIFLLRCLYASGFARGRTASYRLGLILCLFSVTAIGPDGNKKGGMEERIKTESK